MIIAGNGSNSIFLLFMYSFDVGLESPFCQFQAIHIKLFISSFNSDIIRTQNTHKHPRLCGIRTHDRSVGSGVLTLLSTCCVLQPCTQTGEANKEDRKTGNTSLI
jgi:hypothetical protein